MRVNRHIKRIVGLFLCLTILVATTYTCFAAASARDAVDSVVTVAEQYRDANGKSQLAWGTGFAIGKPGQPVQYIVTNYHVVKEANETAGGVIQVYFSAAANQYVQTEVYWKNAEKDLAILKLPEPTTDRKAMVICMSKDVNMDDTFSALGYPATESAIETLPKFDKSSITITRGGISKTTRIDETDLYLLDLNIDHGNSGGPLVNSKGEVVGINSLAFKKDNGQTANYAIEIDELVRNVDRSVIPLTIHGEINTLTLVLIIGGAVVILLVIALVLVLVLGKNKKSRPAYVAPAPAAAAPKQELNAYMLGIAGAFAGQRFSLSKRNVIGRDNNKCNIVFPLDAPGISGVHCEVYVENGGIYLRDLGSSYGTFLSSGLKAAANQPIRLNNGETFYLANEENKFEVRIG